MARVRLDRITIVQSALLVIDRESLEALTLSAVASQLGVGSPALYNHVANLDDLRHQVAVHATNDLADTLRDDVLGHAGDDAVATLAHAYRAFAAAHPARYASTLMPPQRSDDELALATTRLIDVFAKVIGAGYGLDGDAALHCARTARSAIHGFVSLEAIDAFTAADRDDSFAHLIATVIAGIGT